MNLCIAVSDPQCQWLVVSAQETDTGDASDSHFVNDNILVPRIVMMMNHMK